MIQEGTFIEIIEMNLSSHRSSRHIGQTYQNRTSHFIVSPTFRIRKTVIIPSDPRFYKQIQCRRKTYISL